MKRLFLISLFITSLVSISVQAQTQQGYVKTKGRMVNGKYYEGQRIPQATVLVKDQSAVLSKADGTFSFLTPKKSYFIKQVEKKGYVLLDQDVLYREYTYSANPLVLVMDDKAQLEADRRAIERQVRRVTDEELQRRSEELEALKEQKKITEERYHELLQKINNDYDNNEQLIKDMVEQYNKIDFDRVDEFNRKVSDYIINGRLEEADSMLHTKGSFEERKRQLDKLHEVNEKNRATLEEREAVEKHMRQDLAQDYYSIFLIFKMKHQNDSAAKYIELRANMDTTCIQWQEDASFFFHNVLIYPKAEFFYTRTLSLYQHLNIEDDAALKKTRLMIKLANLYKQTKQIDKCKSMTDVILSRISSFPDTNIIYGMLKLEVYNLKTELLREGGKPEQAFELIKDKSVPLILSFQKIYSDSSVMDDIADNYFELFTASYIGCLHQIGQYCIDNHDYQTAEEVYLELMKSGKELNKVFMIGAMIELAKIYSLKNQLNESEMMLQDALAINKELYKEDSLNTIAVIESELLYNLALLYKDKKEYSKSIQKLEEAQAVIKQLSEANSFANASGAYDANAILIENELGGLYAMQGRYPKAIEQYEKMYELLNKINDPEKKLNQEYSCFSMLSMLYSLTNNKQAAYKINGVLIPLLEDLVKENPALKDFYSTTLGNQSFYAIFYGSFEEAERLSKEAMKINTSEKMPVTNLAASLLLQGKYSHAKELYSKYRDDFKDAFLQDLDEFEKAGIIPVERKEDVERIRMMLSK